MKLTNNCFCFAFTLFCLFNPFLLLFQFKFNPLQLVELGVKLEELLVALQPFLIVRERQFGGCGLPGVVANEQGQPLQHVVDVCQLYLESLYEDVCCRGNKCTHLKQTSAGPIYNYNESIICYYNICISLLKSPNTVRYSILKYGRCLKAVFL